MTFASLVKDALVFGLREVLPICVVFVSLKSPLARLLVSGFFVVRVWPAITLLPNTLRPMMLTPLGSFEDAGTVNVVVVPSLPLKDVQFGGAFVRKHGKRTFGRN